MTRSQIVTSVCSRTEQLDPRIRGKRFFMTLEYRDLFNPSFPKFREIASPLSEHIDVGPIKNEVRFGLWHL
jgi:hypothetical protein